MRYDHHDVYVGKDVGGRECVITPELIATYEAGTGDRHPWYHDASPFGGPVAPALLFHSEVYRRLSWYLPNLIGNLHARQEWEFFAPMLVGNSVRTRSTVVERYRKRNRDYIVNEVLITDSDGRWLQRSRTHQSFLVQEPIDPNLDVVDKQREKRSDRRFDIGEGPGEAIAPATRAITLAMCEAFSGPEKNYHTDRDMARMLGFPDVVVQGMMSICFVSEIMTKAFGEGWFLGGKLSVNLVNVVWGNDTVTTHGKIRERNGEGTATRVHLDVWSEKADATKTLIGSASAVQA
ncbi:MAG: MaoC family dehydratase [Deltaproteobacteria bacterium]|nr:MaoC family dehydratase [Deltaproteobacteria bacterium]MBI3387722.1 MaoC family dehydratase [Deltaproteobacteria bacterium]